MDDHQFTKEIVSVGDFSTVCSQIVVKCLYLVRICRPDILWSVNNLLVRSRNGEACDKRSAGLISYIHHTCEYRQYCYVGHTAQQCSWPGVGVPKACQKQAAADSRGSRTCVCANTWVLVWHTHEWKGELTSCRGTVKSAWQKTSSETQRRKNQAARKGKWSPRGARNRQAPPILEVRPGNRQGW